MEGTRRPLGDAKDQSPLRDPAWAGVVRLASLRDGASFTGRVKRVARRLGEERERMDDELFANHGGRACVLERLRRKWADREGALTLTAAEERLMLVRCLGEGFEIPHAIEKIDHVVGYGVFATRPIRAREPIGEYAGVLRRYRPEDAPNAYLAVTPAYGKYDGFVIDGRDEGNFTRFINHSRRRSNISNQFVFFGRRWHRVLRADRPIAPGEQLLWDYGEEYWRHREAPLEL